MLDFDDDSIETTGFLCDVEESVRVRDVDATVAADS